MGAFVTTDWIAVTWDANPHSELRYHLYRATPEAPEPVRITAAPLGGTRYEDAGLPSGTYIYRVRAVNAHGVESAFSAPVEAVYDGSPPELLSTVPAEGATDVAVDAPIVLTFSEEIAVPTRNYGDSLFLVDAARARVVAATATWEGVTATITPAQALDHEAVYELCVATRLTDLAGHPLVPPSPSHMQFRTAPLDAWNGPATPLWVTFDGEGWPGYPFPSSVWSVGFTRPLDPATVNNDTVGLESSDGAAVPPVLVELGANDLSIRITPLEPLDPSNWWGLRLKAAIRDRAGNPISWWQDPHPSDVVYGFFGVYADQTPPRVTAAAPGHGDEGVRLGRPIRLTFWEQIDATTVTPESVRVLHDDVVLEVTRELDPTGRVLTLRPAPAAPAAPAWPASAALRVAVSSDICDRAGKGLDQEPDTYDPQPFSLSFVTGAATDEGPFVVGYAPVRGATQVLPGELPKLLFSEPLAAASLADGGLELSDAGGVPVAGAWTANAERDLLTFTPTAALPYGAAVEVAVRPLGGPRDDAGLGFNQTPQRAPAAPFVAQWTVVSEADLGPAVTWVEPSGDWTNNPLPLFRVGVDVVGADIRDCVLVATLDGEAIEGVSLPSSAPGVVEFYLPYYLEPGTPRTVRVTVTDPAGRSRWVERTLGLDWEAPVITGQTPDGAAGIILPSAGLRIEFADPQSGVETVLFSVDGAEAVPATTLGAGEATYTPAEPWLPGWHAVTAEVRDRAGNQNFAYWYPLQVDGAAPEISALQPAPGSTLSQVPWIAATFWDDTQLAPESGVLEVDGVDVTHAPQATPSDYWIYYLPPALDAGPHVVRARVRDVLGQETQQEWSFVYDPTAPTATLVTPAPGSTVGEVRPTIEIQLSDGLVGSGIDPNFISVVVSGWENAFTQTGNTLTVTPSADLPSGDVPIAVWFADLAGNPGFATWSIHVDPQGSGVLPGPDLAIVAPDEGAVVRTPEPVLDVHFTATVDAVDRASLVVTLDPFGGSPVDLSAEAVDTATGVTVAIPSAHALALGEHAVRVDLADTAGRVSTAYRAFTVDDRGPILSIAYPAEGALLTTARPSLRIDFAANGTPIDQASLRVKLEPLTVGAIDISALAQDLPGVGGAGGGVAIPLPEELALADGSHELSAELTDTAGRTSVAFVRFRVDVAEPVIQVIAGGLDGVESNPAGTIRVVLSDPGSGLANATFTAILNKGTPEERDVTALALWWPQQGEMRLSFAAAGNALPEGRHTLTVTVEDQAGHTAVAAPSFVVDLTPPVLTLVTPVANSVVGSLAPRIEVTYTDELSGVIPATARLWINDAELLAGVSADLQRIAYQAIDGNPTPCHEGLNTLRATVSDAAGHAAELLSEFAVIVAFEPLDPDAPAGPENPLIRLMAVGGQGQSGLNGSAAGQHLLVKAADRSGRPLSGIPITFQLEGEGVFFPAPGRTTVTDASGVAGIAYAYGNSPSASRVSASLPDEPDTPAAYFQLDGQAPQVTVVQRFRPPDYAGEPDWGPLEIRVADLAGHPLPGVEVEIPEDTGVVEPLPSRQSTDAEGVARIVLLHHHEGNIAISLPYVGEFWHDGQLKSAVVLHMPEPPRSFGLSQSIIRSGQGQVVAPGQTLGPVAVDATELLASSLWPVQGLVVSVEEGSFFILNAPTFRIKNLHAFEVPGVRLLSVALVYAHTATDLLPGPGIQLPLEDDGYVLDVRRAEAISKPGDPEIYSQMGLAQIGYGPADLRWFELGADGKLLPTHSVVPGAKDALQDAPKYHLLKRVPPGTSVPNVSLFSLDPARADLSKSETYLAPTRYDSIEMSLVGTVGEVFGSRRYDLYQSAKPIVFAADRVLKYQVTLPAAGPEIAAWLPAAPGGVRTEPVTVEVQEPHPAMPTDCTVVALAPLGWVRARGSEAFVRSNLLPLGQRVKVPRGERDPWAVYLPASHGGVLVVRSSQPVSHRRPYSAPIEWSGLVGRESFVTRWELTHLTQEQNTASVEQLLEHFSEILNPAGSDRPQFVMVPPNQPGVHLLKGPPDQAYALTADYFEIARAEIVPWNFWFYSFRSAATEVPVEKPPKPPVSMARMKGPLAKWDSAYGLAAGSGSRAWELNPANGHYNPDPNSLGWEGHCEQATLASILFAQPPEVPHLVNGIEFSAEDVEALLTKVCKIGQPQPPRQDGGDPYANEMPAVYLTAPLKTKLDGNGRAALGSNGERQVLLDPTGKPIWYGYLPPNTVKASKPDKTADAARGDFSDAHVAQFHGALQMGIARDRKALFADLADETGQNASERWHHAVYKHISHYLPDPSSEPGRRYQVRTVFYANRDLNPHPGNGDTGPRRVERAKYVLHFDDQGEVIINDPGNNWISCHVLTDAEPLRIAVPRVIMVPIIAGGKNSGLLESESGLINETELVGDFFNVRRNPGYDRRP